MTNRSRPVTAGDIKRTCDISICGGSPGSDVPATSRHALFTNLRLWFGFAFDLPMKDSRQILIGPSNALREREGLRARSNVYGHFTSGGNEERIESTLPPVRRPKMVPRS